MARVDYDRMAEGYESGRSLPAPALESWGTAIAPFVAQSPSSRILDLGAGTGMWADAFANWSPAQVIGIDPAEGMRREARRAHAHARVHYLGGRAEALPFRDRTFELAWLSTVIHHLDDLTACAREVRRVVLPGAPVLIRSAFPDDLTDLSATSRFFPGALGVIDGFPTVGETARIFQAAGFRLEARRSVAQESAPSLAVFLQRVRTRADTTLALLPDDEFAAGLRRLEEAVARETEPQPVVHRLGLLLFR